MRGEIKRNVKREKDKRGKEKKDIFNSKKGKEQILDK